MSEKKKNESKRRHFVKSTEQSVLQINKLPSYQHIFFFHAKKQPAS